MFKTGKIAAFLLAAVMTLGLGLTSFAYVPHDAVDSKHEEAIETLGALEIMVGDAETGAFRPTESLKRSEFAKVATLLLGLGEVAQSSMRPTKFPDVVENHWANGYINVAVEQGIVIGDDEGNFRPDDTISYAEAMTMLVRAAGYEPLAESKGGFPSGYLSCGSQIGISKGTQGGSGDKVSRETVAQMTFNTLTVDMMEQVGFGENASFEIVDKTILEDILDVTKASGQITAIGTSAISGTSSLDDDEVRINDEIYEVESKALNSIRNLLGFNVIFYVKDDGSDEKIILARPENNKNNFVRIEADDIEAITENDGAFELSYWLDQEKDKDTQDADISAEAKLIFNGKATAFDSTLLKPESGRVVLLDVDRDEVYDIVFVTSFENYVVEEVIESSNRVTDKYGKTSLILDPKNTNVKFTITKGEQVISLTDLKEWDVLSVAKSQDGKIINIEVSSNFVTGKVTEIRDGKRVIDGKEYDIAANYTDEIKLNDEGTFYLDVTGKIAAVDKSVSLLTNYAYLTEAGLLTGFDKYLEMEVFTKDGEIKILTSLDKIKFNGTAGVKPADVLSAISDEEGNVIAQLITFETNKDGDLTQLNTAVDKTETGAVNKNIFTKNVAGSLEYVEESKKLGAYNVNEETVVFDIPAGKTDASDFSIDTIDMFENGTSYDVEIFDLSEDMTAKVIVVTNSNGIANLKAPIAIIDSVTKTANAEDDTVDKVYVYENGERTSYLTETEGVLVDEEGNALTRGDIVQLKLNAKGEIENLRVLFKASAKDTEAKTDIDEDLYTVYGKVVNKFTDSINVTVDGGATHNYKIDNAICYEYDSTKTKNAIKVIDAGDIAKFDEMDPQRVFIKVYKNVVTEIVVVK